MRSNVSFGWSVVVISIVGIIFSWVIISFPLPASNVQTVVQPVTIVVPTKVIAQLPVNLIIPKIKVDAFIEYLGITPAGAMDVPAGPSNVAWFDLGPRPGDIGSAVIAGHEGWKNNIPAVFDNLYQLQVGDTIYTEDGVGSTTAFIVRKIQTFGQYDSTATIFDSTDGKSHLNLITCEGIWNPITKSSPERLVVFADKE